MKIPEDCEDLKRVVFSDSVGREKIRLRTFLRISKMVIRLCL